jgi:hypothetical protein
VGLSAITPRSSSVTHSILRMSAYRASVASPLAVRLRRSTAVAVFASTAVVLAGEALSTTLPATAAAWGGMALAAWCGTLLLACSALMGRDGLGLAQWKLGSWFLLWCALAEGLASITWAYPQYGLTAQILPSSITRAEWITGVAITAWATAYCYCPLRFASAAGVRFMHSLSSRRSGIVRGPMTPWLLYAAGTTARITEAVLTGHLGYLGNAITTVSSATWYQQALNLATFACPLAITVAGLRVFRERAPGAKATLTVLLAAEITSAAVMGIKGLFVTAVMAVAIAAASAGRSMPRWLILAATAFFLLIVIPFTLTYRAEVRGGPADLSPGAAAVAAPAVVSSTASAASTGTIAESVSYLSQRLQEIDAVAIVLQKTPSQVPYASPAQIPETLAAGLIPRALWPGKPILTAGYQFSQQYYGTPQSEVSAAAVTPMADLYRYGGWVPLLTGMLMLGWLTRIVDEVLDVRANPHAALLVLLLWSTLATPEDTFTGVLLALPSATLTWLAVTAVAFHHKRAQGSGWASLN